VSLALYSLLKFASCPRTNFQKLEHAEIDEPDFCEFEFFVVIGTFEEIEFDGFAGNAASSSGAGGAAPVLSTTCGVPRIFSATISGFLLVTEIETPGPNLT
jgi:hypothetical protein